MRRAIVLVIGVCLVRLLGACDAERGASAKPFGASASVPVSALAPGERRIVLFACEHGVGRSAIAAAHFNRLAAAKGLTDRAVFRGTGDTGTAIPPAIQRGLAAEGFDTAALHPARVVADDVRSAAQVVVLDTELPSTLPAPTKLTRRSGIAGPGEDYPDASTQIRQRIEEFVASLIASEPRASRQ